MVEDATEEIPIIPVTDATTVELDSAVVGHYNKQYYKYVPTAVGIPLKTICWFV